MKQTEAVSLIETEKNGFFGPEKYKAKGVQIMKKVEVGTTIQASEVEQWKWGYICPECGGEMEPSMDEPPIFDKLDKQSWEEFECRKCGTMWSALYDLVSIQKETEKEI